MSERLPDPPSQGRTGFLASVAHGTAAALFAAHVAPNVIALPAFVGGALGARFGGSLARSTLRTAVLPLVGIASALVALGIDRAMTFTGGLAGGVGPAAALRLSEALVALTASIGLSASMRGLAVRVRALAVVEVAALVALVLRMLLDHRLGAVNRPFEVADPMLAIGRDPKLAFLFFGAAASVLAGLMLVRERSRLRTLYHFLALFALTASCFATSLSGILPGTRSGGGGSDRESEEREQRRAEEERRAQQSSGRGGSPGDQRNGGTGNRRRVVAVVLFHDDFSPPSETYYFRAGAYARYEGPWMVESEEPDVPRDFPSDRVILPDVPGGDEREAVETTVAMVGGHPHPLALEAPLALWPVENPDATRFTRLDRVRSVALTSPPDALVGRAVGDASWDPTRLAQLTAPHPDLRYAELARRIVDETLAEPMRTDPVAQAIAINVWLGREGVYSKHHLGEDGPDPATEFLFGERIGYCVHFSHAAVNLYRALGIPSRVGVGFAVPEASRRGGSSLLVTDDFGHAWPEIYVDGLGWVIFDVFPERSLDPPPSPADVELTRLLGELARGEPPPTQLPDPPNVAAAIEAVLEHTEDARNGLGALLALVVVGLYLTKWARRYGYLVVGPERRPVAVYRSVADRLAELGVRRRRGETREAFAARVALLSPTFAQVTHIHVSHGFGGRAHRARIPELPDMARATSRDLRVAFPWYRRLAAVLDPVSFLTSR